MRFVVHGNAAPQGSKVAFVNKHTGRAQMREASDKLKPWRAAVAAEAAELVGGAPLLIGPVRLEIDFMFPRPASHFGTGKNAGVLKRTAPFYVSNRSVGDLDKLIRSVCDSLTGVVWTDDSQVVEVTATKRYGVSAMATIGVVHLTRQRVTC